jgi:hypothetical protein
VSKYLTIAIIRKAIVMMVELEDRWIHVADMDVPEPLRSFKDYTGNDLGAIIGQLAGRKMTSAVDDFDCVTD